VTGIEPALSAWETNRSGPLTALTWTSDVPPVTVTDPVTHGLMARQWPAALQPGGSRRWTRSPKVQGARLSQLTRLRRSLEPLDVAVREPVVARTKKGDPGGQQAGLPLAGSLARTAWTGRKAPLPAGARPTDQFASLDSVACPSATACVAVGGYYDSTETNQGLLVPRHPTFALSPTGTCVARSARVEEDGFAGGPSVGCAGGPLP
jgi:hypothetical protein